MDPLKSPKNGCPDIKDVSHGHHPTLEQTGGWMDGQTMGNLILLPYFVRRGTKRDLVSNFEMCPIAVFRRGGCPLYYHELQGKCNMIISKYREESNQTKTRVILMTFTLKNKVSTINDRGGGY